MNKLEVLEALSKLRPNATFLTLRDYCNDAGEVSDVSIVFHISYESALNKSIEVLSAVETASELEEQAKQDLLTSWRNSLARIEQDGPVEIRENGYTHLHDENGNWIKGVKIHDETGCLHLNGMVVHKKITVPGQYTPVNSRPLTKAKNKLMRLCPMSKFRQYKIVPEKVGAIRVDGLDILPPEN